MANLKINYAQNPDLKDIFKNWEVGKSYTLEIDFQLLTMDDEGAEGSINEVGVDDGADGKPSEVEPDSKEPVMVVIMANKDGKGKKSKSKEEMPIDEPMMAGKGGY